MASMERKIKNLKLKDSNIQNGLKDRNILEEQNASKYQNILEKGLEQNAAEDQNGLEEQNASECSNSLEDQNGLENQNFLEESNGLEQNGLEPNGIEEQNCIDQTVLEEKNVIEDQNAVECCKSPKDANEIILKLNWDLRDELISNLNRHIAVLKYQDLLGKSMRTSLFKENNRLIQQLISLPLKVNEKWTENKPEVEANDSAPNLLSGYPTYDEGRSSDQTENNPVLDLEYSKRDSVILTLMKNHHCAVLFLETLSEQTIEDLIKENNDLMVRLMSLPLSGERGYCAKSFLFPGIIYIHTFVITKVTSEFY